MLTGSSARRDHPRSRGVYTRRIGLPRECSGSSPLARGLRGRGCRGGSARGIIPARAGFTHPSAPTPTSWADHPRSRGVYQGRIRTGVRRVGSSPLARGLQRDGRGWRGRVRIIPARAGFTGGTCSRGRLPRDHPRSRGVYVEVIDLTERETGSSPLARGLHLAIGVIPTVGHPTRGRSPSLVT